MSLLSPSKLTLAALAPIATVISTTPPPPNFTTKLKTSLPDEQGEMITATTTKISSIPCSKDGSFCPTKCLHVTCVNTEHGERLGCYYDHCTEKESSIMSSKAINVGGLDGEVVSITSPPPVVKEVRLSNKSKKNKRQGRPQCPVGKQLSGASRNIFYPAPVPPNQFTTGYESYLYNQCQTLRRQVEQYEMSWSEIMLENQRLQKEIFSIKDFIATM